MKATSTGSSRRPRCDMCERRTSGWGGNRPSAISFRGMSRRVMSDFAKGPARPLVQETHTNRLDGILDSSSCLAELLRSIANSDANGSDDEEIR